MAKEKTPARPLPQIETWTRSEPVEIALAWYEVAQTVESPAGLAHTYLILILPREGIAEHYAARQEPRGFLISTRTHDLGVRQLEKATTWPHLSTHVVWINPRPQGFKVQFILECGCGRRTPDMWAPGQDTTSFRLTAHDKAPGWAIDPTFCPECLTNNLPANLAASWQQRLEAEQNAIETLVGVRLIRVQSPGERGHAVDINTAPWAPRLEDGWTPGDPN